MKTIDYLKATLFSTPAGFGHYKISFELDSEIYSTITTNLEAVRAAFSDDYDFDGEGNFTYKSRDEAKEDLVNEILIDNNIRLKREFT